MNNSVTAAANLSDWQVEFCDRYALLMLAYGRWFLLGALIIGAASALVALYLSIKSPPVTGGEGGGSAFSGAIDAIKGLVESFSKAPIWLAMLGSALLLLWMAGNSVPSYCTGEPAAVENLSEDDSEGSNQADNAAEPAGKNKEDGEG